MLRKGISEVIYLRLGVHFFLCLILYREQPTRSYWVVPRCSNCESAMLIHKLLIAYIVVPVVVHC